MVTGQNMEGTMICTPLTERYGIELPVVSAGMGFIAVPPLAAAVSNAGGLGQLATGTAPPAILRKLSRATRALTDRPFAVNFIIETTAFGPLATGTHLRVCIEERVPAVVFHWAPPPDEWIRMLKQAACDVWLQTSSIATAQAAIASGVDIIIAQGSEAGGHNRSTTGLFTLLPRMVDAVHPAPVIGAGGIADGSGMAAAFGLGAGGVCVGTGVVATVESNAHDEYKRRITEATEEDIARTCIFGPEWPNAPMRVIRNRVVREWAGNDAQTPPQPDPPQTIGKTMLGDREYLMPKFAAILPTPETTGDFEEMCLAAGESAALVTTIGSGTAIGEKKGKETEQIIAKERKAVDSIHPK